MHLVTFLVKLLSLSNYMYLSTWWIC